MSAGSENWLAGEYYASAEGPSLVLDPVALCPLEG
jgi:hypothetical protein